MGNDDLTGYSKVSLAGKAILITGAGQGIGRATAMLCARRGARVHVTDRDIDLADTVQEEIVALGGIATASRVDITREDDVRRTVGEIIDAHGALNGAFNNAGIISSAQPIAGLSLESWQRVIDVNLTGTFLCLKHEIAHMGNHGGGSIVNSASRSSVVASPGLPAYVASKHGVLGLTRSASADYSQHGIRVNAILPGVIVTPMTDLALQDPQLAAARRNAHPIGRFGQPEEVGELAAWLLSDAASFSTGSAFFIDGGANGV
ncbi:SDR family NAD(P)-dependent oxidoreductase [Cryobacterium aureum]|uniref:SDR family NAD(P)-dependent oxidoreductase n=1 Tax=Cryobacterium aureum TaxID=995037 RepID=UPI000CF4E97E|nr:SDR family NAD(P)-dependent oxidoreductase [Cryobacterium aureum]